MKSFIYIGDVHIKLNNLYEIDILQQKIKSEFENKNNNFILSGDILHYHEKILIPLLNKATELIELLLGENNNVYIIVGNHDYINNQQFLTKNHWMNSFKKWNRVFIIDYPTPIENILLIPFVPPEKFEKALNIISNWKDYSCVITHQEIKYCKLGSIKSMAGMEWKKEYPPLISGHIHERQYVGDNVFYPGSCINHAFSKDSQGVFKFYLNDNMQEMDNLIKRKESIINTFPKYYNNNICHKYFNIGLDKKKIINITIDNYIKQNIKDKYKNKNTKICFKGTLEDIVCFKKSLEYKELERTNIIINFKPINKTNENIDIDDSSHDNIFIPFSNILNKLIEEEEEKEEIRKDFLYLKNAHVH